VPEWFETFLPEIWFRRGVSRRPEADFIRRALRLRKGQQVLDAPCGDGQVAACLAQRGMRVTGVDLQPRFIAAARRRLRREGLAGTFRVLDLRRIDYAAEFHAALNWYGAFGYVSEAENLDVLRRLARALRPGGRLLVDQVNRERMLRGFRHTHRSGETTTRARWDAAAQRVETTWSVPAKGGRRSCRSSIRIYTPAQMRRLFARAGLEVTDLYDDWAGGPHSRGSARTVVVGRKA
jgi:SAM-dependent methyltransferase